jgi:hypothetical protein
MSKSRRHLAFKNVAPMALGMWYNHQEGVWDGLLKIFLTELCPINRKLFLIKKGWK